MKHTPILIISIKNSQRINILKERLEKLDLNYNTIIGIDGEKYNKKKRIGLIASQSDIIKNIGRKMAASEIGAAASHLKTYRYIIKNNIQQCIIMEDDCFPSILFKEWAYSKIDLQDKQIFSFYSYANGFVHKRIWRTVLEKINIHKSKTHLFNSACYQININTCKKFIYKKKKL